MFRHVFAYRLKYLLRSRQTVFWTLLFPIMMSLLFAMALSNVYQAEVFHRIPIAVVNSPAYRADAALRGVLEAVSIGEDPLFELTVMGKGQAKDALAAGSIKGYLEADGGLRAVVSASGIEQTILKSFLDRYLQMQETAGNLLKRNPAAILTGLIADLSSQKEYTRPLGGMPKAETLLAYYYALLAMACLYGGFWGAQEVNDIQANLSQQGARVGVAPVHKLKAFMAGMTASFTVQYSEVLILLAFMRFVIGVDFGNQLGYILILCFAGSLMGITFGAAVAAVGRKSEGATTGILIAVSMLLSFFSGLMFAEIKYIVARAFPAASYLNPAALVADGFYALYYYESHGRYWLNVGLLIAFSTLFCLLIYRALRRRKYASL